MGLFGGFLRLGRTTASPALLAAVERAVEGVEPRLKQAGGYPDHYLEAVACALEHCRDLAGRIPGPIAVTRETHARDPKVRALFHSIDEVRAAMCVSQAMRDYRKEHPAAGEVYALMAMRRNIRRMFGMELEGETLRRDVPQQVIYFTDHTLADPAPTEAEARERMVWGLFDSLLAHVRRRMEGRRLEKSALEEVKDDLLARLRAAAPDRRPVLEAELREVLAQMQKLSASLELGRYREDFDAVLRHPGRYLYLEQATLRLDEMGIRREGEGEGGMEITFSDLIGRDRRRWTVVVVHCGNVMDEATVADRLQTAQRWLGL